MHGKLNVRYLPPTVRPRRIAVCRPDSLAGTNQGPMGEDIEPMIDQEMFLQMMESMDKDGDGTVTKARLTPHARALTHPSRRTRTCVSLYGWRAHADQQPECGAPVCKTGSWLRRVPLPSSARLPWPPACAPCAAQLVEPVITQHQTIDLLGAWCRPGGLSRPTARTPCEAPALEPGQRTDAPQGAACRWPSRTLLGA